MLPQKTPLLLALATLVALAPFASGAEVSYDVKGLVGDDGSFYFEFVGIEGKNPTVAVKPGDVVTVNFVSEKSVHNFRVTADLEESAMPVKNEGESATLTFTVPESLAGKTIEYWCDPHKGLKMAGVFQVEGDGSTPTPPPANETPGFEAALAGLAVVGIALLLRRR